jgi:hypothetical protein
MTRAQDHKPPRWRSWLISFGVPTSLVAAGLGMLGFINFWRGFIVMSVGFGLASILLWWLVISARQRNAKYHAVFAAAVPVLLYAAVVWLVLVPAPLDVGIALPPGNYQEGRDVAGLKWRSDYSPMIVVVRNETGLEYTNLDIWVRTSEDIAGVGIASGIAHCAAQAAIPGMMIASPSISTTDKEGKTTTVPLTLTNGTFYRVQCDRLGPMSGMDLTIAAVVNPRVAKGSKESSPPTWGALSADYEAAGRRRSEFFSECLQLRCGHRPTSMEKFLH